MLMMRLVGEGQSRRISVRDAAVRTGFYRRTQPDGTTIDDVEAMLGQLESNTLPLLPEVRGSWPLSPEAKGQLAFLFGHQLVRGPRWWAWYEERTRLFVDEKVRGEAMLPDGGLGTAEEIQQFEDDLLSSVRRRRLPGLRSPLWMPTERTRGQAAPPPPQR
jgi:Protein of unknown function (DUF4238)